MDDRLAQALRVIRRAGVGEIEEIERALQERRRELGLHKPGEGASPSQVLEGKSYRDGWLQLERRIYERKDGGLSVRGPYWYFRYHEEGRQRKLYLGKTEEPEAKVEEKRRRRGGGRGEG
jgi:hypothetical protein